MKTIDDFKKLPLPDFDFELMQPNMLLVQVFASKPESSSIILTEETKKSGTEIRNIFRVLTDTDPMSGGKYSKGDIVSLQDVLVEPPIVDMQHPVGNDPSKPKRPVFGRPLQAMESYSFDCSKTMEKDYKLDFVYLIPQEFITVKHN
jgi:hypothetical protein